MKIKETIGEIKQIDEELNIKTEDMYQQTSKIYKWKSFRNSLLSVFCTMGISLSVCAGSAYISKHFIASDSHYKIERISIISNQNLNSKELPTLKIITYDKPYEKQITTEEDVAFTVMLMMLIEFGLLVLDVKVIDRLGVKMPYTSLAGILFGLEEIEFSKFIELCSENKKAKKSLKAIVSEMKQIVPEQCKRLEELEQYIEKNPYEEKKDTCYDNEKLSKEIEDLKHALENKWQDLESPDLKKYARI